MASSGRDDPQDGDGLADTKSSDNQNADDLADAKCGDDQHDDGLADAKSGDDQDADDDLADAKSGDNQRGFFARVGNSYLGDALSRAQKLRSEVERLRQSQGEKAESPNPPTSANVEGDLTNSEETSPAVHSPAVTIPQTSPFRDVRDAFRLVRKSSSDATKDLKFPTALFSTSTAMSTTGDKDEVVHRRATPPCRTQY